MVEWKKEMPTKSGWYWVISDLNDEGISEIIPCYYDARYGDMQSIEGGIACEIEGILAVAEMEFPMGIPL